MSAAEIRVVVVDDHALFRQGVLQAIDGQSGITVVGEAEDVASGIESIRRLVPNVVVLDVHLPDGSGVNVMEPVTDLETVRFLGLSVSDAPEDVLGLVRAGARGYITKRTDAAELVDAITQVHAGNAVFSPRLAGFVLDAFRTAPTDPGPSPADAKAATPDAELDSLTPREQEVMRLLARGYTHKEIGVELYISARTVESHASAVLRKLQLSNRHELTHWAAKNQIV